MQEGQERVLRALDGRWLVTGFTQEAARAEHTFDALAGVDPQAWLRDVLVRIDRERDFEKLLPAAWKQHFAGELDVKRQDLIRRLAN